MNERELKFLVGIKKKYFRYLTIFHFITNINKNMYLEININKKKGTSTIFTLTLKILGEEKAFVS